VSGAGQRIDTSLLDAGVALSVWESTEYFATGRVPQAMGSAHRMSAPYQAIRCADGYITLAAANDRLFARLCDVLGHPDWAERPEFRDDTHRVQNRAALAALLESVTAADPRAYWLGRLAASDIPCGPINNYAQVFADPQVQAREMVVDTDHPTLGRIRTLGSPIKMSRTPVTIGRPAPRLGEHTEAVLREAGCDEALVAELCRAVPRRIP
jgi:crotonobetainyl-CoA:carnitine CoA-transferase CaiB-like acyl-CoA transferase